LDLPARSLAGRAESAEKFQGRATSGVSFAPAAPEGTLKRSREEGEEASRVAAIEDEASEPTTPATGEQGRQKRKYTH